MKINEKEGFDYLYSTEGESMLHLRDLTVVLVVITVYCFQGVCGCWPGKEELTDALAV